MHNTKVIDIALKASEIVKTTADAAKMVFLEREQTLDIWAATFVAGQHALFLGKPGVSKTQMIKWLAKSTGLIFFNWALGNNDGPEDIFGQNSYRAMTEEDLYVRRWKRLSQAHVALLDEPGKMASSGQNMLLRALQERDGEDDRGTHQFPLHMVCAGSNELFLDNPAFYDRFHTRIILDDVQERENFWKVVTGDTDTPIHNPIDPSLLPFCRQATDSIRQAALKDKKIDDVLWLIKGKADKLECRQTSRRYKELMRIAAGNALLCGRDSIVVEDLFVYSAGLWTEAETFKPLRDQILELVSTDRRDLALFQAKVSTIKNEYTRTPVHDVQKRAAIATSAVNLYNDACKRTGSNWKPVIKEIKNLVELYTNMKLA